MDTTITTRTPMRAGRMLAVALIGALALAGCETAGPNERTGTVVGGVGGTVVGGLIGGWKGAVIGGLGGIIVGNLVGRDLDARERERVQRATYQSAMENRRVDWRESSNSYGYSQPTSDYYRSGVRECRNFDQVVTKNGRSYHENVTVCRNPDGTWSSI